MSYSFSIKGKFKVESELVRDVIQMLKDIEIEYERPKKTVFRIDDDGVLDEIELSDLLDTFEHIFEYIIPELDQSIFVYIHELDPVDREVIINENNIDLMTDSNSKAHVIFLEKSIMKNAKGVIDEVTAVKNKIMDGISNIKITAKWTDIGEVDNPFILPVNHKIKIKGGNRGVFISALLDEDLHCENYEEVYKIKGKKEIIDKFKEGYIGIKIAMRAFSNELDEKVFEKVVEVLRDNFDGFHDTRLN